MVHRVLFRVCCSLGISLALLAARELPAQTATNRAKDEAAVRRAGNDYAAAIESGNDKVLAEFWTADGTCTDGTGRTVKVQEMFAKSDDTKDANAARYKREKAKVRFIADDVAMEEGEINCPAIDGEAAGKARYTALWVRQAGRWKLENLQETAVEATANADQVSALNVFVGEWSGKADNMTIRISAKWDTNKKFLRREVTISSGKASLVGTQQIGWDPLSQQIRSWMFNDDGSFSEGLWSREGYFWMALSSRVLPDGRTSQSTQVYKFPDKNTLVWKTIRASVDGQPIDDFQVTLKRSSTK